MRWAEDGGWEGQEGGDLNAKTLISHFLGTNPSPAILGKSFASLNFSVISSMKRMCCALETGPAR
jgi:hypothetical protein